MKSFTVRSTLSRWRFSLSKKRLMSRWPSWETRTPVAVRSPTLTSPSGVARLRREEARENVAVSRVAPLVPGRRMFAHRTEGAAQIDEGRAIQMQRLHGCPAGGSKPLDDGEIPPPGKMARPPLA